MMKVWVMQGSYEGELFSSVHLTQKGCVLACIDDLLQFHGIDDEETALAVCDHDGIVDGDPKLIEWDREKLKEMTSKQLWKVFADWCEISWDRMADQRYDIAANPVEIQA